MPKPPKSPPSSDIEGVDRDWRIGLPSPDPEPNPGEQLEEARRHSIGLPGTGESEQDIATKKAGKTQRRPRSD